MKGRKMRKLFLSVTLLTVLMLGFSGCEVFTEGGIDPNRVAEFEQGGKAVIDVLQVLSVFVPGLIPVATAATGIFVTWKKMKPKLTDAQVKENMANNAGMVLAELVEEIKQKNPETWAKHKDDFKKAIGVGTVVEQTIRGFRGLNPR